MDRLDKKRIFLYKEKNFKVYNIYLYIYIVNTEKFVIIISLIDSSVNK